MKIQNSIKLFAYPTKNETQLRNEIKSSLNEYNNSTIKAAEFLTNKNDILLAKLSSKQVINENILSYYLLKNYILYRFSSRYSESNKSEAFMEQFPKEYIEVMNFNTLIADSSFSVNDILYYMEEIPSIKYYLSLVYINAMNDSYEDIINSVDTDRSVRIDSVLFPAHEMLNKEIHVKTKEKTQVTA